MMRRTGQDWEHELKRPGTKLTVEEMALLVQIATLERIEILKLMLDHLIGQIAPVKRTQAAPAPAAKAKGKGRRTSEHPAPVAIGANGQEAAG